MFSGTRLWAIMPYVVFCAENGLNKLNDSVHLLYSCLAIIPCHLIIKMSTYMNVYHNTSSEQECNKCAKTEITKLKLIYR